MDLERTTGKYGLVGLDSNFILHSRCKCDRANKSEYEIIVDFVPFCFQRRKKVKLPQMLT